MFNFFPFLKSKIFSRPAAGKPCGTGTLHTGENIKNQLKIKIGDVLVKITRKSSLPPENELHAVIPRVEIRRRFYYDGKPVAEEEMILNSITLVDAPVRPTGKP